MKTVVCVLRSGGDYSAEYVRRLKAGITANTRKKVRFVCLCDEFAYAELKKEKGIILRLLTCGWPGWWSKMEMFKPSMGEFGDFLYIDLDTVICGNIDKLLEVTEDACLRDVLAPDNNQTACGSGIMFLTEEVRRQIWNEWFRDPPGHSKKAGRGGDQMFLHPWLVKMKRLQDILPTGFMISYKKSLVFRRGTQGASVVIFHGVPRPHSIEWQVESKVHFCCFKWKPDEKKLLPSQRNIDYGAIGADHVNRLFRAVGRNLHIPHRFVCITDDPAGLAPGIAVVPLWDDCAEMGGCYRRLKIFSKEIKDLIGNRIVMSDIDIVVTGDITPLVDRPEPLILYRHSQHLCNGGWLVFDAGARSDIWENFDPASSTRLTEQYTGTDQSWLKWYLGPEIRAGKIKTIGKADGFYDFRNDFLRNGGNLPADCRVMSFAGPRDPSQFTHLDFVQKHWI